MPQKTRPTAETYGELQQAYDHFNKALFDGKLPDAIMTLQREKATYGYFSAQRFGNLSGQQMDEIALNPIYFGVTPLVEIMATLVHEMTHLCQHHFGKPGRGRYHNNEWADMMERIGLMPSSTGKPGGARTGDQMADYPIEGGPFLHACEQLLTQEFSLSWYDRFPTEKAITAGQNSFAQTMDLPAHLTQPIVTTSQTDGIYVGNFPTNNQAVIVPPPPPKPNKSNRVKYLCQCARPTAVWGKPGLRIRCDDCNCAFSAEEEGS